MVVQVWSQSRVTCSSLNSSPWCRRYEPDTLTSPDATGPVGVIRGSAVNQDGRSSSLTAPAGPAQTALMRAALRRGNLAVHAVQSFSLHGTGTPLGDPIEIGALGNALGRGKWDAGHEQRQLVLASSKVM